jgi:hypothetical protein
MTTTLGRLGVAGLVLVLASALACQPAPLPARSYTGPLRAPSTLGPDFLDRQRIVASYGDRELQFDAVVQKKGDELTLLGLTPFGTRAFVVRQTGTGVFFQSFVPQSLPFPPRYILIDIHRVFFGRAPGAPIPADGERETVSEGESVVERWKGGRLLRRVFRRVDGNPPGDIVVEYDGGFEAGGPPPARVMFRNGWYGYRLDIMTQSHQLL